MGAVAHTSYLIYGPSGSGLTTALAAFREFGFLTSSGMSLDAIPRFFVLGETEDKAVAICPEIHPDGVAPEEAFAQLQNIKTSHPELKLLYLSSPTDVLIQRYADAEKAHPYETTTLKAAIEAEQAIYQKLKPLSDYHIDTSTTSSQEIRHKIAKLLNIGLDAPTMTVNLMSFGFKHGVPTDAEMVFDMRFLPNPFYIPELKPKTGLDKPVSDYVLTPQTAQGFIQHWEKLLAHTLPLFQAQGKTRITLAIGCTGGQHRSVAMTEHIAKFLKGQFPEFNINIIHRETSHWPKPATVQQGV